MDAFHKKIKDDTETLTGSNDVSEIQKFYADKTVFLTGSTGFMGMCLVEKLLRGCPDLKTIYVLVRPKRGASMEQRMKSYFDNVLFDSVRKIYPNCESKVHAIEGDLVRDDLGLSEKDTKHLIEELNYIIHNASNVKFNVNISLGLKSNVMGTMAMINLAKKCKKLEVFMYVSTAFSHCYQQDIEEKAYEPPADMNSVRDIIAADTARKNGLTDKELDAIVGKFPNVYCFTKATAEGLIDQMGKEVSFPCIIFRPTIVVSSWKEPLRSWCGNVNGPALLFVGYALGIVRTIFIRNVTTDFIPVDMSINSIIVAIWDTAKNRTRISGSFVYNYGSSTTKPITVKGFKDALDESRSVISNPSIYTIWKDNIVITECIYYFAILHVLLHFIPAVLMDAYLFLNRKKMQAVSNYKKITLSYSALKFFCEGNWRVHTMAIHKAVDRMNSVDRQLFFCDIRELDWVDFALTYWNGLRVYILKDPMSSLPAARQKLRKICIVNDIIKCTFFLSIAYIIVSYLRLL